VEERFAVELTEASTSGFANGFVSFHTGVNLHKAISKIPKERNTP